MASLLSAIGCSFRAAKASQQQPGANTAVRCAVRPMDAPPWNGSTGTTTVGYTAPTFGPIADLGLGCYCWWAQQVSNLRPLACMAWRAPSGWPAGTSMGLCTTPAASAVNPASAADGRRDQSPDSYLNEIPKRTR